MSSVGINIGAITKDNPVGNAPPVPDPYRTVVVTDCWKCGAKGVETYVRRNSHYCRECLEKDGSFKRMTQKHKDELFNIPPKTYPYNPPEKLVDETHWFKDSFRVSIIEDEFQKGLVRVTVSLAPKNANADVYELGQVITVLANPNDVIMMSVYKRNKK